MMKRESYTSGSTWLVFGLLLVVIVLVYALMALIVVDWDGANAEIQPESESSDEYVRSLEARISYLETLNANTDVRLDKMEREQAERKSVLDDLVHRDAAASGESCED